MATAAEQPVSDEREDRVALPDGRVLSYAVLGRPDGPTTFVLDGPRSRGLARAAAPIAQQLGARLVAPDRPGAGRSTPRPGRTIADWPADLLALADALGVERFGLLAQSGGTPYALATAAAAPERVRGVAFLGAVSPLGEPGAIDDVRGPMRLAMTLARRAPFLLRPLLAPAAAQARRNPRKAAEGVLGELPPRDAELLADPALFAIHVRATAEILAGPGDMAYELRLLARPWGVDLARVRAPVAFWAGDRDGTHPPAMARRLAQRLPGDAPVHVLPDAGTFGLLDAVPDALRFLAPPRATPPEPP